MRLPLPALILELNLKPAQKTRHELVNLEEADILANARARARAKLQHRALHLLELVRARVDPALGPEHVDVEAKDLGPPVHDPRVAAHDGAAGDEGAEDLHALGWDDALEDQAWGGVQAEGFLDDGVEVGEFLGFGPRDGFVGPRLDGAGCDGGVEFVHEFGVDAGVFKEEVEDCGEGDGSCF